MSATIPESMRLDDLLKATGYDCPAVLQGETFDQATESSADLEDNKEVTITENGEIEITPATGKDGMKKVTATINVSGGGSNNVITLYYCKEKNAMIGLLNIESEGVAKLPNQWDDLQYVDITPVKGNKVINNVNEIKYLKNGGYASYSKIDGSSFYLWESYGVPYTYTIVPTSLEYSRLSVQYGVGQYRKEIDVSSLAQESYTEVIRPSDDATAMNSLELVLTGIPTGGARVYCWIIEGGDKIWLPSPSTDGLSTDYENFPNLVKNSYISNGYAFTNELMGPPGSTITIVDSTTFKFNNTSYVRASDESEDFNLW